MATSLSSSIQRRHRTNFLLTVTISLFWLSLLLLYTLLHEYSHRNLSSNNDVGHKFILSSCGNSRSLSLAVTLSLRKHVAELISTIHAGEATVFVGITNDLTCDDMKEVVKHGIPIGLDVQNALGESELLQAAQLLQECTGKAPREVLIHCQKDVDFIESVFKGTLVAPRGRLNLRSELPQSGVLSVSADEVSSDAFLSFVDRKRKQGDIQFLTAADCLQSCESNLRCPL